MSQCIWASCPSNICPCDVFPIFIDPDIINLKIVGIVTYMRLIFSAAHLFLTHRCRGCIGGILRVSGDCSDGVPVVSGWCLESVRGVS